jgi:hypothetical protein
VASHRSAVEPVDGARSRRLLAGGGKLIGGSWHNNGGKQRGKIEAAAELWGRGKANGICPLYDASQWIRR